MTKSPEKKRTSKPCPICGGPPADAFRPFCSRRCADVDLGRWLGGDYRLPAEEERPDDEPEEDPPQ
ncbi:MAG: DNA gyrase inhibitor YacG [Alphaproteobacteria bacterium]|nr:DNA gyrase inhibitor YacG [Alphaproteobacteria bacterium]MBF0129157.1 DNA gyrase inhibitor YacG [Alphaproteobacteria bacterium]